MSFPKSLDVSKAIDRARTEDERPARIVGAWLRARREERGLKQKEVAAHWPSETGGLTGCVANWELGFNCPKWDQWLDLKRIISFGDEMDAEVWRLNGRKGKPGDAWSEREFVGVQKGAMSGWSMDGSTKFIDRDITNPTENSRRWSGWGTSLKPAHEPIILARKPLIGTVSANVLAHGTGALNIDACRIRFETVDGAGLDVNTHLRPNVRRTPSQHPSSYQPLNKEARYQIPTGRWPANLILDEEAARALDQQSGELQQDRHVAGKEYGLGGHFGVGETQPKGRGAWSDPNARENSGGASRFFYTAKASATDRNDGLEGMPAKFAPAMGNGIGGKEHDPDTATPKRNVHPTVKPFDLMRWLVRLVTPPGGTVLDCFAGSGSTGVAAIAESFNFIGIEISPEYAAIAERRIANVAPLLAQVEAERAEEPAEPEQLNLDITGAP